MTEAQFALLRLSVSDGREVRLAVGDGTFVYCVPLVLGERSLTFRERGAFPKQRSRVALADITGVSFAGGE